MDQSNDPLSSFSLWVLQNIFKKLNIIKIKLSKKNVILKKALATFTMIEYSVYYRNVYFKKNM